MVTKKPMPQFNSGIRQKRPCLRNRGDGMGGGGVGAAAQRRPGQAETGDPVAGGNDGHDQMDCATAADGDLDVPEPLAILPPAKKHLSHAGILQN